MGITEILQLIALIAGSVGAFRQYILKPYFDHRDEERKWREQFEKMKEEREEEREERQKERTKSLGEKYDRLDKSILSLTGMIKEIYDEQQQMLRDEVRYEARVENIEGKVAALEKTVYDK